MSMHCLDRVLGLLLCLQLGVKGVSLVHNGLVLVVPVKTGQNEAAAETVTDVGDDLSSQGAGDGGNHCSSVEFISDYLQVKSGAMSREPIGVQGKKKCTGVKRVVLCVRTTNLKTKSIMISRVGLRAARPSRNFQTSARAMNNIFGTPKAGVYSNLPFRVKGLKIPFGVYWWGTFGFFFAFPFLSSWWHMKKAGNL